MKRKLTLQQEKDIYDESWREVYNECFFMGIVDRQKIGHVMHRLNMIDERILTKKHQQFSIKNGDGLIHKGTKNGQRLQEIDQEGKRSGEGYQEGFS